VFAGGKVAAPAPGRKPFGAGFDQIVPVRAVLREPAATGKAFHPGADRQHNVILLRQRPGNR